MPTDVWRPFERVARRRRARYTSAGRWMALGGDGEQFFATVVALLQHPSPGLTMRLRGLSALYGLAWALGACKSDSATGPGRRVCGSSSQVTLNPLQGATLC